MSNIIIPSRLKNGSKNATFAAAPSSGIDGYEAYKEATPAKETGTASLAPLAQTSIFFYFIRFALRHTRVATEGHSQTPFRESAAWASRRCPFVSIFAVPLDCLRYAWTNVC